MRWVLRVALAFEVPLNNNAPPGMAHRHHSGMWDKAHDARELSPLPPGGCGRALLLCIEG